jgi:hypothetical protein
MYHTIFFLFIPPWTIQGDFEGCTDILIPQKVTIELVMPHTNVNIFREKRVKSFSSKVWEPLNFMKKWVQNSIL